MTTTWRNWQTWGPRTWLWLTLLVTGGGMTLTGWALLYGVAAAQGETAGPASMSNAALWALIVGFLQGPLQALIQRPEWSASTKSVLTFALSFLLAGVQLIFEGALDDSLAAGDYVRTFMVTFIAAQAFYRLYWRDSNITGTIETKTSPGT